MQWSRLKKLLESRFCESLAARVQIHTARYTNDQEVGRIWIVLDKREIFSVGDQPRHNFPEWFLENGCVFFNSNWGRSELEGHLLPDLNLSIEEALVSPHALTRALALFDKRVGKRRLQTLREPMKTESLLARHFYALRCEAEELPIS